MAVDSTLTANQPIPPNVVQAATRAGLGSLRKVYVPQRRNWFLLVFLFLIGAVFVPLTATVVIDFWLARGDYDTSETAPARWAMLLPWLAGFVAYQLTAPTVLSAWPAWEAFWRHGQELLHISPTNGFSASIVAFAVAGVLTPAARLVRSPRRPEVDRRAVRQA